MYPLISTQDLATMLAGDAPPVLLDVRWTLAGPERADYRAGHLPGAVFVDVDAELASPAGPGDGRHPLPDPEALQAVLRSAGVRADHAVVAYDAADGSIAARAWWLLRWAGHRKVAVLDGGYARWVAEGRPTSTDLPTPSPGDIVVRPGGMPVLSAAEAAELARSATLLDARAPARYRGETEPMDPRAGHVPGARSAPFAQLTDADGRWLDPQGLRELAAGWAATDGRVGAYCGSGITACALVLAFELAGITSVDRPVGLYAGSWSHWSADPARPAVTGPDPG